MVEKAQITKQTQNTDFAVEANLKFVYEGNEEDYIINFKLGGKSSPESSKPGYNIKIKGDNNLHGTKDFRLRSDQREASMMRSKITTDVLQKSGLIAVEVGYTELYVNDEYMGFWVVSDSVKNNWIKRKFGENVEEIKTLFQCKEDLIRFDDESAKKRCHNADDKNLADYMEPFNTFVDQVNAAKTREELDEIMDVDNFVKYMAWEYLMGSWDHFLGRYGHNLYWYQQPNGKWVYIPYDHDIELGQDLWNSFFNTNISKERGDIEYANVVFKDFELNHPIIKILVHDDDTLFRQALGDIVSKVFNPDTILAHIDDIKALIDPYVKKDRESGAGKINKVGKEPGYTYEHFLLNSEYTYVYNTEIGLRGYGLKDWIRRRYNFVASYYGITTDSTSPEKKHKLIEPRPEPVILPYKVDVVHNKIDEQFTYISVGDPLPEYTPDRNYADNSVPTLGVNQYNLERSKAAVVVPTETTTVEATTIIDEVVATTMVEATTTVPNTTTILTTVTVKVEPTKEPSESCWSESLGYKCCSKGCKATVYYVDKSGDWGVEGREWCGIPSDCERNDECPGSKLGYPCCKSCKVRYTDKDGKWGVENQKWCSISDRC